jgi:predicted heme/steroid binding protein
MMVIALLGLGVLLLAVIYYKWRAEAPKQKTEQSEFTLTQLKAFNSKGKKVYLACNGLVYDVSSSDSYQEGGSYAKLAGCDASVALARMDLSDEALSLKLSDVTLTADQQNTLESWGTYFQSKGYEVVGRLAKDV